MPSQDEQKAPVVLPEIGAGPVELSVWFAEPGESVYEGDRLVEVCAGAATFDIPSPVTGRLISRLAEPRDRLKPGQVLGYVQRNSE